MNEELIADNFDYFSMSSDNSESKTRKGKENAEGIVDKSSVMPECNELKSISSNGMHCIQISDCSDKNIKILNQNSSFKDCLDHSECNKNDEITCKNACGITIKQYGFENVNKKDHHHHQIWYDMQDQKRKSFDYFNGGYCTRSDPIGINENSDQNKEESSNFLFQISVSPVGYTSLSVREMSSYASSLSSTCVSPQSSPLTNRRSTHKSLKRVFPSMPSQSFAELLPMRRSDSALASSPSMLSTSDVNSGEHFTFSESASSPSSSAPDYVISEHKLRYERNPNTFLNIFSIIPLPEEKIRASDGIVRLQAGTNKYDSQKGMTGFGTARRETTKMVDTKHPEYDHEKPDQSEIPLQSGTNKFASQKGMTGFGTTRRETTRIVDNAHPDYNPESSIDSTMIPYQMGSNKYASQKGMTGFGQPRWEVLDPSISWQNRKSQGMVRLQSGTNRFASQAGWFGGSGFGTPRNTTYEAEAGELPYEDMKKSEAIIPSQAGWNKGDSQRGMTSFGAPRDVRGKHLKRIWELEYPEEAEVSLDRL